MKKHREMLYYQILQIDSLSISRKKQEEFIELCSTAISQDASIVFTNGDDVRDGVHDDGDDHDDDDERQVEVGDRIPSLVVAVDNNQLLVVAVDSRQAQRLEVAVGNTVADGDGDNEDGRYPCDFFDDLSSKCSIQPST